MEKRIAELQIELRKKDSLIYELKRELFIKDTIIHKQVVMMQQKDEQISELKNGSISFKVHFV